MCCQHASHTARFAKSKGRSAEPTSDSTRSDRVQPRIGARAECLVGERGGVLANDNGNYLVPVHALSQIFRAKICAALNRAGLLDQVPPSVWSTPWVVHCQHAGRGQKVLDYLGRYIFRVAIANSRLERIEDGQVTFRYRDNQTQHVRRVTLTGVEFLRR